MGRSHRNHRKQQKGLVLVLTTAAMLALIGIAALAVDVNHALLNKTRLQNAVDAAALAAAIVMDDGGTRDQGVAAANAALTSMAGATGNAEMDFTGSTVSIQFSNDPALFPSGGGDQSGYTTTEDSYIRVLASGYDLEDFFAGAFGFTKDITASAVAGPSSSIQILTNVVPIAVCEGDDGGANGYNIGQIYALKLADQNQSEMGSGNYQLLDFGSGADTVREALAGGYKGTIDVTEPVITKPGNTIGPVGQGLNTRFGDYGGAGLNASDYPPDEYVYEPNPKASLDNDGNVTYNGTWGYQDYLTSLPCNSGTNCPADGQPNRRILPIPIVDCSTASGGTTAFDITAIGCFFMLQSAPTSNSGKEAVFGEFIEDCTVTGGAPGDDSDTNGAYRIVLYKDPLRTES